MLVLLLINELTVGETNFKSLNLRRIVNYVLLSFPQNILDGFSRSGYIFKESLLFLTRRRNLFMTKITTFDITFAISSFRANPVLGLDIQQTFLCFFLASLAK